MSNANERGTSALENEGAVEYDKGLLDEMAAQKRAAEIFGITTNINEAGFILTDGRFLDLSEKNNGAPAGERSADHRGIAQCYEQRIDGTDALIRFMNEGNIRVMPECGGIDIAAEPTEQQYEALRKFINYFGGEVIVDISSENGNNLRSYEYSEKTSSTKVVEDIQRLFLAREHVKSESNLQKISGEKPSVMAQLKEASMRTAQQSVSSLPKTKGEMKYDNHR